MIAYEKKIRDRTPAIKAAGKLIPRGPGAKECLTSNNGEVGISSPKTPDLVKQFRCMTRPEPGQARVYHSMTGVQDQLSKATTHGVKTTSSLAAGDLMNPPRKSKFEQVCLDQHESIYNSKQKGPLGSSHDQSHGLPNGIDPMATTFGLKTIKQESAGDMISPQKSMEEVDREYNAGRELYKKSHNDWGVGEVVDRDFDWSTFTKGSLYGVPTPHDNSGSQANQALHWQGNTKGDQGTQVVSKRLDDFRERTQPQLGQVHDPIAETLDVDEDHTFGTMVKPDDYNAGSLMHMEGPTTFQETMGFDSGVLSSVRNKLNKNNFYNFDGLLEAFQHYDKDGSGMISHEEIRETCFQFNMPLTPEMLEMLIRWCTGGAGVVYSDLVTLINWKIPLEQQFVDKLTQQLAGHDHRDITSPSAVPASRTLPNSTAPSPLLMANYRTSSQMFKATVGGVKLSNSRSHGVPTIRSDLPAPRIKRVGDHTNYGDESDAYGLMYPSIYSNNGVYENDFFEPRDKTQVRQIFENIGVSMSDDVFQELWKEAETRDPGGQVSVESFRAIMEEVQAQQLQQDQ